MPTLYEYDTEGFLVGWHTDASRPNSTTEPPPYGGRSRWTGLAWVEDASREQAAAIAAERERAIVAVQRRLDAHAQSWGYDSLLSAATYTGSKKAKFRAEGQALMDWRDDTWAVVDANQNTVQSVEELLALLPPAPPRP